MVDEGLRVRMDFLHQSMNRNRVQPTTFPDLMWQRWRTSLTRLLIKEKRWHRAKGKHCKEGTDGCDHCFRRDYLLAARLTIFKGKQRWWMWKFCKENILIFVNGNGCIMNDNYTNILRLKSLGKRLISLRPMKQTITFGKFFPEGLQNGFVNVLGQEATQPSLKM